MPYCSKCGTKLDAKSQYCSSCGAKTSANESSSSISASHEAKEQPAIAGLGRRFVAFIIDAVIVVIIFFIVGSNVAEITGAPTTNGGFELEGGPALLVILLTSISALLYFTLLETFWGGKSLGRKLVGIKVVGDDRSPISFNQSIVRNVIGFVDLSLSAYIIGFILALRSPINQRFGDRIAKTIVIEQQPTQKMDGQKMDEKSGIKFSWGYKSKDDSLDF